MPAESVHLPALLHDLFVILATAAVVTLLCKAIRQPVVLGYLVAGFLVGPHVPWIPSINDLDGVKIWAEAGVIFLLFGLGLEFSFKKLIRVGPTASVTAFVEVAFMMGAGYLAGKTVGWSNMDSLFLGGILAISSTTIIVRAIDELGMKGRHFVSVVFGVLIVEDLFAVLLLVLLSTVAITRSFSGAALMGASAKLAFFLVLWFAVGLYLLPRILRRIRGLLGGETRIIISLALCLGMVVFATSVGFSAALGAFVMGSILAETREGKLIEHALEPIRHLFAAIFFVSVGMLINPQILIEHFGLIGVLVVVTIVGKLLSTTIGALLSGESLKHSVQTGMSLAQIGEFSFIIAALGTTLGVTSDFLSPLAVAVSAVTTLTTPFMIRWADPLYAWIEKRLSPAQLRKIESYQRTIKAPSRTGIFSLLISAYASSLLLNSVMILACGLSVRFVAGALLPNGAFNEPLVQISMGAFALFLGLPFLWALVQGTPSTVKALPGTERQRLQSIQFGVFFLRLVLGFTLLGVTITQFAPRNTIALTVLIGLAAFAMSMSRYAAPIYKRFERGLVENLQDGESDPVRPALAPWDAHMEEFVVSPTSSMVTKTLVESRLKEDHGVTVAMIERGHRRMLAPGRDDVLLPGDRLFVIGNDEELKRVKEIIEIEMEATHAEVPEDFGLTSVILPTGSKFHDESIRSSKLREAVNGLIVGIERDGERHLNPDSSMKLKTGDVLWLVGDLRRIHQLRYSET